MSEKIDNPHAENARLREALTPSLETKRAYIGEFYFWADTGVDEHGDETQMRVMVPWITIKEIMKAILDRAALSTTTAPDGARRTE